MNQDYDLVLTDSGRAIASCIYRKHCYFKDRLISAGVSPETAEIEACRLNTVSVKNLSINFVKHMGIRAQ